MKTATPKAIAALGAVSVVLLSACFYDVDRSKIPDDDEGSGSVDDGGLSGLGEPCSIDGQCDTEEANYCAVDTYTGQGVCTVKDCLNDGCPSEHQCCDCTGIGYPSFCVENSSVERLSDICPCS